MTNTTLSQRTVRFFGFSFGGLFARLNDWNEARRTREILSRLSAHELDDIGLVPGDIDRIAKRGF